MPHDPKSPPPRRLSSQDTVPIDREELVRAMLEAHGPEATGPYEPVPDDEPTSPDLRKLIEQNPCTRCKGSCKSVEERPDGTYHGPVDCPRCGATGLDPDPPPPSQPPEDP